MIDCLFIVNSKAGTVARSGSLLRQLRTEGTEIIEPEFGAIDKQLEPYLATVETIAVEGGDGTLTGVIDALLRVADEDKPLPKILLISGGSTNLVASAIGAPRTKQELADLLAGDGELVHLPALRIEGAEDDVERAGFFLASGSIPKASTFCREAIQERGVRGMSSVFIAIASVLLGNSKRRKALMAPTTFEADADGSSVGPSHRFSVVTTLPRLTKRFVPFWAKGSAPINLLVADADSKGLARAFVRSVTGRADERLERDGYISRRSNEVSLAHDGPYLLDGESFSGKQIKVSASRPIPFQVVA
ncbi:MAG: diacylglycerol kinase family protein [Pseudomonadota bacterium]